MSNINDFVVENGVLTKYTGSDSEVVIPDGVTTIVDRALENNDFITSIKISETVTDIGDYAFRGCGSLKEIKIGCSVSTIGDRAFGECESLQSVEVAEGNAYYKSIDGVLYSADGRTLLQYPCAKSAAAFVIPDGVTIIKTLAFAYNEFITSIKISETVTEIGGLAFKACVSLKAIEIGKSVSTMEMGVFLGCQSLQSIDVAKDNTYYKSIDGVLYSADGETLLQYPHAKSDATFVVPDRVTFIDSLGSNEFITNIIISETVTEIGASAFSGCSALKTIKIGKSVSTIGWGAIDICVSLESIEVAEDNPHYKSIDGVLYTADDKTLLRYPSARVDASFFVPDSVTSIADKAFYFCGSVLSVILPVSVTNIGDRAFCACKSLQDITISNNEVNIGDDSFAYCDSLKKVNILNAATSSLASHDLKWWKSRFVETALPVVAFENFNGSAKIVTSMLKSLKSLIKSLVSVGRIDLLKRALDLNKLLSIDEINDLIEISTKLDSTETTAILMAYKADHYTSDNLDKREEDRILKQLGEKEMSVEDWKKIFKFKVAKGKAVITKYLGADTVVEIPSTIGPNVVVGIASKAFGGCKNITNIIFPKTLTCIEQLAFHGCTGLVYNEYNNGYYLGSRDNPYLVFMRIKSQLDSSCELHKDTKIISCAAFYGCSFLEEVILPHGVEIICDGAFRECKVLKSITIPNTVTHIGKCLFWSSNKLTSIEIPDSVVNADPSTFLGSGFKKISLPASLSEFTQDKFCYFTKITVRKK